MGSGVSSDWGVESIVAGLVGRVPLRTPTLPPATHTNAWVLGERRVTVVDPASPWPEEQAGLLAALEGREVERIVLTHHHEDHVGAAAFLRERTGAPVFSHAQTDALVGFEVDGHLEHDALIETDSGAWRLDFTPGHAPGHLCLHHLDSGTVIAGDMVAAVGTIVLVPPEGDLGQYLDSLDRLRALSPRRLCPAHGGVIDDAVGKLTEYIDHRNMRTQQVRAGMHAAKAPVEPLDLVPGIYPDLPAQFHGLAALQVFCHLQWLEGGGEVRRVEEPGATMPRYRLESS